MYLHVKLHHHWFNFSTTKKQKNIGAVFYALLLKRFLYIVAFTTNGVDTPLHNRIKGKGEIVDGWAARECVKSGATGLSSSPIT